MYPRTNPHLLMLDTKVQSLLVDALARNLLIGDSLELGTIASFIGVASVASAVSASYVRYRVGL